MANVRFFRIAALPSYIPTYRGAFVYLRNEQVVRPDELVMGWPNIVSFDKVQFDTNPLLDQNSNIRLQTIWGGTFDSPNSSPQMDGNGIRYNLIFDSVNGIGYVYWGNKTDDVYMFPEGKLNPGLWFGGENRWELLTNEDGLTALDAQLFQTVTPTTNNDGSTTLTFNGIYEEDGIIHQGTGNDTVTIGDGVLSISGKGATDTSGQTPVLPNAETTNVHSANDTTGSILTLDDSLVWLPDDTSEGSETPPYSGTIGVRVNTTVTAENPVATMADIAAISGAMHLIGSVTNEMQLPTPDNNGTPWNDGDTWIVTGNHGFTTQGDVVSGWSAGIVFEPGDTIVYLYTSANSSPFRRIQANLTIGVEVGYIPSVASDGTVGGGPGLTLGNGESNKLVATNGEGLIKTELDPDTILSGTPSRNLDLDNGPADTIQSGQVLHHSFTAIDALTIGSYERNVYSKVSSPNTSIDFTTGSQTISGHQYDTVTVDLVWRESIN